MRSIAKLGSCICLGLLAWICAGPASALSYVASRLIDTNPGGGDFIDPLLSVSGRFIFEAYDGAQHKLYTTDGRTVNELAVEGNGTLRPESLFRPSESGFGIRRINDRGYFVANGPFGRSLYRTDGVSAEVLASGVSGEFDYDVYNPPVAWESPDYLYFRRETESVTGLYRTDGVSVVAAGLADAASEYRFLTAYGGDALLVGSFADGDVLVRENASGTELIETPPGLRFDSDPTFRYGDRLGFTGGLGEGARRLSFFDGSSIQMIDIDLTWPAVRSPTEVAGNLYFKGRARSISPYKKVLVYDGTSVEAIDLGFADQSSARIIATLGNDAFISFGGLRRVNGSEATSITIGDNRRITGASLVNAYEGGALFRLSTSTGEPFSASSGLFHVVGDTATEIESAPHLFTDDHLTARVGEALYLPGVGDNGYELFRIEGDEITEIDINPNGDSHPASFRVIDDRLYFVATGPLGREFYVMDGDDPMPIDLFPEGDGDPWFLAEVDGAIYVRALTRTGASSTDRELFVIRVVPEPSGLAYVLAVIWSAAHSSSCRRLARTL